MVPFHVTNKGEVKQMLWMAGLKYHSQVVRILQASSGISGKQQQEQYTPNQEMEI